MRLIGTQKGYWVRIWRAQRQLKKRDKKTYGSALTSVADCKKADVELNKHSSNQVHPVPVADPSTVNSTIVPGRDMAVTPKR